MRHTDPHAPSAADDTDDISSSLLASKVILRASGQRAAVTPLAGIAMTDPAIETASWLALLLAKFLPASLGALLMIAVRPPPTRRELFTRVFVALTVSFLFTDFAFDFLHSFSWFAFLNEAKKSHVAAVAGFLGSVGWFIVGGVGVWLDRFRGNPVGAVDDVKRLAP